MAGMNPVSERLSMLMSCYLDGALLAGEIDEVVAVLDSDLDAIAEFHRLKGARRAVRLLPMLEVPLFLLPGGHLSEQLSAFLDGELTTAEVPIVTDHLLTCVDCRHELADLDKSRIAVRALPGIEPPEFLSLKREEHVKRRGWRAAAVVATGVAAVTLAFALGPFSSSSEVVSVTISDLDARHAAVASVPAFQVSTP